MNKSGYRWAYELNSSGGRLTTPPVIVFVTGPDTVLRFGDDYDYPKSGFEFVSEISYPPPTE